MSGYRCIACLALQGGLQPITKIRMLIYRGTQKPALLRQRSARILQRSERRRARESAGFDRRC
ncbi:hypothetical protein SKC41_27810 [Mycobacterium sp. 050128]|uniref:hypothetical protein n=1 Tax=Mycobacterium sp. 050128 TaxID=3096112 RepID=UPI002EDB28FC